MKITRYRRGKTRTTVKRIEDGEMAVRCARAGADRWEICIEIRKDADAPELLSVWITPVELAEINAKFESSRRHIEQADSRLSGRPMKGKIG